MLLRLHGSFVKYSNQGFEASHKVHRALYSRATSHDQAGVVQSMRIYFDIIVVDQILTHSLSETMLDLRFQFIKAKECIDKRKKTFHFRGCGWGKKPASWSNDYAWIVTIVALFDELYGNDHIHYVYDDKYGTIVEESSDPSKVFLYDHDLWEGSYDEKILDVLSTTKCTPTQSPSFNNNTSEPKTSNDTSTCTSQCKPVGPRVHIATQSPTVSTGTFGKPLPCQQFQEPTCTKPHGNISRLSLPSFSAVTRKQLSEVRIPPITSNFHNNIKAIQGTYQATDPCILLERLPRSTVDKADETQG
ncbi:hypothetical protein QZH41_019904 [Actinostola sp. cb2023]|nr:hypothetical protein QZH41_019904 [Actinostola sp. cb2023]